MLRTFTTQMARSACQARLISTTPRLAEKSLNDITLLGRCGKDPIEVGQERTVLTFPLATNSPAQQAPTDWHRVCVTDEGLMNYVNSYIKRGQRLLVKGSIRYKNIDTEKGNIRLATVMAHTVIQVSQSKQQEAEEAGEESMVE